MDIEQQHAAAIRHAAPPCPRVFMSPMPMQAERHTQRHWHATLHADETCWLFRRQRAADAAPELRDGGWRRQMPY